MSDQQIRDEAMTIFLAGHETTANAMSWTWHLLAGAPEVERKLHDEIDHLPGTLSAQDVPKLEYTRAVVAESMRLFPPAWTMGRRVVQPHVIGGYGIPVNALVLASQWVVHRDPRWWDDPAAFRPERWLTTDGPRPRYAYFPFGGGSRVCIGESFAWTEAILLTATIAQRWRFARAGNPPPQPEPRITLRPSNLRLQALARARSAALEQRATLCSGACTSTPGRRSSSSHWPAAAAPPRSPR